MRLEYSKVFPDFVAYKPVDEENEPGKIRLFSVNTLNRLAGRRILKRLFKEGIVPPLFPDEE